jgi:magnesium chelatase subunit D
MEADEESSKMKAQAVALDLGGRPFPLSMIVGQDNIKQSLLLSAINGRMGGVAISGGKGTAKSVMARALHQLLPPIEVIKGSPFNIDPVGEFGVDDFLKTDIAKGGTPLEERETEIIRAPFVQVPLNVMEDRLIGSADLEESVKTGKSVFSPGLLAKAHRGVLYVDDINLLDEETANILLNVVNDGYVLVEREGISLRYPCKPLLIATFNPDEGELRDHLLDRIAVSLSADAQKLDVKSRVEAVDSVIGFAASGKQANGKATMDLEEAIANEEDLKTAIIFAREYLRDLTLAPSQMQYLCEEAIRAGCQGHRAEIFAVEVARAAAAIEGRQVNSDDLKLAVKLAIAPRGTFIQTPMDDDEMMPPPPPPPQPPQMDEEKDDQEKEEEEEEKEEEPEDEEDDTPDEAPDVPEVPEEFMFDVDATPIDPDLIEFTSRERAGKGGGRGLIFSQDRGRYIKPMLPKGKVVRLAGEFFFSLIHALNNLLFAII